MFFPHSLTHSLTHEDINFVLFDDDDDYDVRKWLFSLYYYDLFAFYIYCKAITKTRVEDDSWRRARWTMDNNKGGWIEKKIRNIKKQ